MKFSLILTIVALFSLNLFAKNGVKEKPYYGEKINTDKAVPLEKVIEDFSKYQNKEVVMEAMVEKVCSKKGCWMTLEGTSSELRVKFKDYKFFVPFSLIGKKIWIDGQIDRKELSAITKPTHEYHFTAKGVKVVQ